MNSDFDNLVNLAVNINLSNRSKMNHQLLESCRFFPEFATVHINPGRRTGKTRYIIDHADKESLVIFGPSNTPIRQLMQNRFCVIEGVSYLSIPLYYEQFWNIFQGNDFSHIKKIYIDEPSLCFYDSSKTRYQDNLMTVVSLEYFYDAISPFFDKEKGIIIMLGE